ncbi:MAG: M15 family metallopeptidase [Saprospiraceae bacterium]
MKISTYLLLLLIGGLVASCTPREKQEDASGAALSTTSQAVAVAYQAESQDSLVFTLDYLRGRFDPATHPDFTLVDAALTDGDGTYYLRKDTYAAFRKMHAAAKADGVALTIISATRNFDRQKSIWEAKWTGARLLEGTEKAPEAYPEPVDRALAILRWSSMPGTSRHHWGTDLDMNDLTNEYFAKGKGLKEYNWLVAHAHEYGFCQPYSPKGADRPHGYNEEKWHWSYMPVSKVLTELARQQLTDEQIDGFKGAEVATRIGVVDKYILGINEGCLGH